MVRAVPLRLHLPEIIIQRVKKWSPEQIAKHLLLFDPELCTELFLSELKRVLPTPDQVCDNGRFATVT
jgi:cytokinesis protein